MSGMFGVEWPRDQIMEIYNKKNRTIKNIKFGICKASLTTSQNIFLQDIPAVTFKNVFVTIDSKKLAEIPATMAYFQAWLLAFRHCCSQQV